MTRISVVIPVFNGERYLGAAIESVLGQSRPPLEVIVVDNGSSDESLAVAQRFGDPVQAIHAPGGWAGGARNAGLRVATGEFLAFLDADDLWEPSKLARQCEALEAEPNLSAVFTMVQDFVTPELANQQKPVNLLGDRDKPYAGRIASSMLIRRDALTSVGMFPEIECGEFISWYGMAQAAGLEFVVLPEVLVRRRIHERNSTRRPRSDMTAYLKAAKIVLDFRRRVRPEKGA